MHYLFLALAIGLECGGTYFMKLSDGFSQLWPSLGCLALYAGCFVTLSRALQGIPLSVTYASWGALGIVLATTISAVMFKEPLNAMVVAGVIICIAGVVLVNLDTAR